MRRRHIVASIEGEYRRYKALGEGAIAQLGDEQLAQTLADGGNSVTTIVWHIAGNLASRFTDFLTTDGEKPWRDRESEFQRRRVGRAELLEKWEHGWAILQGTLDALDDGQIQSTVKIRGVDLSVLEALHRSLAHAAYHVGQMVFLAKALRGEGWQSLSIPPGKSAAYNVNPFGEKAGIAFHRTDILSDTAQALVAALNEELTRQYPEEEARHFRLDAEEVAEGRGAFVVGRRGEAPLACGAVRSIGEETGELKRMFVRPEARGQGLGRMLLAALENEARRLGLAHLVLETGTRQKTAIALYERAGFTHIPPFGEYVKSPFSVCMAKDL